MMIYYKNIEALTEKQRRVYKELLAAITDIGDKKCLKTYGAENYKVIIKGIYSFDDFEKDGLIGGVALIEGEKEYYGICFFDSNWHWLDSELVGELRCI